MTDDRLRTTFESADGDDEIVELNPEHTLALFSGQPVSGAVREVGYAADGERFITEQRIDHQEDDDAA